MAVLEARTRGSGQSGKNSGMLMQWNNDFYTNLAALLGKEGAGHVGAAHKAAVDWLEGVVGEEGIECGFERTSGLLVAHDGSAAAGHVLDKELRACQDLGEMCCWLAAGMIVSDWACLMVPAAS